MRKLEVHRKPVPVKLTVADDGSWVIDTPMYSMHNIEAGNLDQAVGPFTGMNCAFTIDAPTQELIDALRDQLVVRATAHYFSNAMHPAPVNYVTNILSDKPYADAALLKGALKDKPIVFCGAGPTLTDNLDRIREIIDKKQAYVIAGGTAARILHNEGIKPHMFIAFDPMQSEWEEVFSKFDPEWTKDVALVCFGYLETKCFESWRGQTYMLGGMSAIAGQNSLDGLGTVDDGGASNTTTVIHLAEYMACKSLHLVGIDLAMKGDSKENAQYYADNQHANRGTEIIEHEGKITRNAWLRESWLIGWDVKNKPYKCYRCPSFGLPIDNVETRSLDIYNKRQNIKLPYAALSKKKEEQLEHTFLKILNDLQLGLEKGFKSEEFFATLGFNALIGPYHVHLEMREVWTRRYDEAVIYLIVYRLIQALQRSLDGRVRERAKAS